MNNNSEDANKLDIKKPSTLYRSDPSCRELDYDKTEEVYFYENISQMVREDGEGSEGNEISDCKEIESKNESCQYGQTGTNFAINDLPPSPRVRGESVLYEKADREGKMIQLINSSSDGWVYVNSGQKNKSLPADVKGPREMKRDDKETVVLCKNNNTKRVTRLKPNRTSQEKVSGINDQHCVNLSDSESEPDVSYVNMGEGRLQTETLYIDMSQDLIEDEYVDMTSVTSQISDCKDSSESENTDLHEVFKPLCADENIDELPVKPRPTPRRRSNRPADNQNPPRPTPRVRTKQTNLQPRQSPIGAALADLPSQNSHSKLSDKCDNRCVTSGDESGLPSDSFHQSSKPIDKNLTELPLRDNIGHAIVESPPPPEFTKSHNREKDFEEVLPDVPLKSVTSATTNTQEPPPRPPKSHNHKKDALGNLDDLPNVLVETQTPPPRPPKSYNQSDIPSDDMVSEPVSAQSPPSRPTEFHQLVHNTDQATALTTSEWEQEVGDQTLISTSPPPLPPWPFKEDDDYLIPLNRPPPNARYPQSSPRPHPPKGNQAIHKKTESSTDQLSFHPRDQDEESAPPTLFPRKSLRELKPLPTNVSSSFKKYKVLTKPQVNTTGEFTVEAQSPPPRPPKTFMQQMSGVSSPEPFSPSRRGCEAPMLPTMAPPPLSTLPHTASAPGLTGGKSQPTTPPNKLGYGIHLEDGPWYACRDVTRQLFPDSLSDATYDYPDDWVVHEKSPKKSPSSESTTTNNQTVTTEHYRPCQDQNEPEGSPDAPYEYIYDWDVQKKSPKGFPSSQSTTINNQTVTAERHRPCQDQNEPGRSPDAPYECIDDWDVQEKSPKGSPSSQSTTTNNQTVTTDHHRSCQYQNVPLARHPGIPQKGTGDPSNAADQNGAATNKVRNECKNVPTPHIKTKQKGQEKKSEKISKSRTLPKETAEKVVTQLKVRSRSRDDDFEDIDLLQLYLLAKKSLTD